MTLIQHKRFRTVQLIGFGLLGIAVLISLTFEQIRESWTTTTCEIIAEKIAEEKVPDKVVDPWGTEFQVQNKPLEVRVISAGPDKVVNTRDDIRSRWVTRKRRRTDLD